jgi:opacity protein-like surface antigen
MIKKIITVAAALMITLGANAQIKYGVKAGLNVSQFGGGTVKEKGVSYDIDATGMLHGFHAGAYANFDFGQLFGLQPEVVFSMQGQKKKNDNNNEKFYLNYINVPVLLTIKPLPNFSILAGPQMGINVYKSISRKDFSVSSSAFENILGADKKVNAVDFAAVLGVQYTLFNHLTVGARYNFGFTPAIGLTKKGKDSGMSLSGVANRVIQVSAGWTF